MVTMRYLEKMLSPIKRRIIGMLSRSIVTGIVEDLQRQNLQVSINAGESCDSIERFQNYGLSSYPTAGSEAILAALGGNLGNLVAIAVEDKKVRPKGELGDVFLYHLEGHKIRLTKDGKIIITSNEVIFEAANSLTIISPETLIQGPLHVTGGISTDLGIFATGGITSASVVSGSDLTAGGFSYLGHYHQDAESRNTSAPVG
ncbi:phage baseplate assembly protein [Vibrio parahaemolyticus]|uniref:Phage baseplate assembly protein V n=1 Tax=Vibrio parahaemolyticus TaxID=670 RepID=A0A8H9MWB6_VIBPH|nr:phage baseplate assembly protein [Vibrio parahaemolyticus]HAS6672783.1 phage baseplate assembly protein V [Vibrio parahaemolyticus]HAS6674828.1 phage baseplate assembly protein V [Vibrio parahaemolyticus]HAS6678636.1 phage baseplate assembly protein V [Vibrio parahaemolyticus]HAS6680528.1 phage baseplate assembly protein V [Vibrio parahaemolyticus]